MSQVKDIQFSRGRRKLTAKRWHEGGLPTLALHGYLDNANSFDVLAPSLTELDIIALDFAGHGHSDYRPGDVAYRADLDIEDALFAATVAGWERFNLIGHSMGAEIGSQLAGLFPEKVEKLICIDGIVNGAEPQRVIETRSGRMEANVRTKSPSSLKTYKSLEGMAARVAAANGQHYSSAIQLVRRGHSQQAGGLTWATDPRLRQDVWEMLSEGEVSELVRRTTAPTLVITAGDGQDWFRSSLERIAKEHRALKTVRIEGSHHLHMEEPSAEKVLAEIREFLGLN